jgi:alpha-aminoadipic semialdehyde synthase
MVIGFAGYGNVSQGAQEIFDLLPHEEIDPRKLEAFMARENVPTDRLYKVVFKEEHLVEPAEGQAFELQDYYKNPGRYRGIFDRYLPHLTGLVNCIYWTEDYPRLISKADAKLLQESGHSNLRIVGDISCDIEGSIEFTHKSTEPDKACFVYDAVANKWTDGVEGAGIVVMAVDNLPCELPKDASAAFSTALRDYIPILAKTDFTLPLDQLDLPPELAGAIITHRGELAPEYRYLEEFLAKS